MPWYENRGLVFSIIAAVVTLLVFGDKIPFIRRAAQSVSNRLRRLRKRPVTMTLEMPEESEQRLEELRLACEKLVGHPFTLNDLFINAINTYGQILEHHPLESPLILEDDDGHRTELHLFETKAA